MSKKKKKLIEKRRIRTKVKKQKRAKSRLHRSKPDVQFIERSALSEMDTPPGFRVISMNHAMMEYAKPLMDFVEKGIVKDPNDVLQLSVLLWNFSLSQEHHNFEKIKKDVINQIGKILKIDSQESTEFFEMMIQRKDYLFPAGIQPDNPMIMFVRKEERYLIPEFNYDSLNISEESYIPDDDDEKLVQFINQIDKCIADGVDYDEWEDHYFLMEKKCRERFEKWLMIKGVKEYSEDFSFHLEVYLNFIYRYASGIVNLKTVSPFTIEEFFVDYVFRKVIMEPYNYIKWPPALKLLYHFLYEIGYLESPRKITKWLDEIEPHFIEILRNRYS